MGSQRANERQTMKRIEPLGMRVVVKLRKNDNTTDTGLYLPEGSKEMMSESILGEIIEVASAIDFDTEEEENISGVPLGALVLIPKSAGVSIPWNVELRIVETREILAIVSEQEIS